MTRLTLSYGAAQMLAPVVAGYMAQTTGSFKGALWLTAALWFKAPDFRAPDFRA